MVTNKAKKTAPKKKPRKTASGATVGRPRGSVAPLTADYNKARTDLKRAQAQLAEIELRQRTGDLIPAAEVARVVSTAFAAIRQDILAIPDKLERIEGVSPALVEKIEAHLEAALEGLVTRISTLADPEIRTQPAA